MTTAQAIPAAALTVNEQREAAKDGKLIAWRCATCHHTTMTPMLICPLDKSRAIEKVELPTTGKIVSFTIQKISIEEFINDVPFAYVVVELEGVKGAKGENVHVPGWVADVARDSDLPLGTNVKLASTYRPGFLFEKA
ncbi:MAG: Zn-ribbon domain-containing OB-fold protein [Thermoplasmatota archaeon]